MAAVKRTACSSDECGRNIYKRHQSEIKRKTGFTSPIINRKHFGAKKKGQFFLLGAFLVSTLFFMGLPRPASLSVEVTKDLGYLSLNMQKEIPNAYNLGIKQGDYINTIKNFTWFSDNILRNRRATLGLVIGFGNNISTTDYNVTIFNYYGSQQTFNITIGTTLKQLVVPNNQSNSTSFSGIGSTLNISFKYADEEKNMTWVRDKRSIFGVINLTRAESVVIKDFEG